MESARPEASRRHRPRRTESINRSLERGNGDRGKKTKNNTEKGRASLHTSQLAVNTRATQSSLLLSLLLALPPSLPSLLLSFSSSSCPYSSRHFPLNAFHLKSQVQSGFPLPFLHPLYTCSILNHSFPWCLFLSRATNLSSHSPTSVMPMLSRRRGRSVLSPYGVPN